MFSFLSKEEPPLQLYGKLPIAKDYLRIGCADGVGRRLREWMDRGFSSALEGTTTLGLPCPLGFLWSDGSSTALLGILSPSSDAGGLRPFPFVLFVERKWRALWSELEEGMAEPERWLVELEGVLGSVGGFADGAALLAGLRGKKVTPRAGPGAGGADAIPYEDWIRSLWPEGQAGLETLLGELLRRARESDPEPLRLPLAGELSLAPQIQAWWSALVEAEAATKKGAITLFFPRTQSAQRAQMALTFFPREPRDGQVGWLTPASGGGGGGPSAAPRSENPDSRVDSGPTLAKSLCGTLALVRARGAVL